MRHSAPSILQDVQTRLVLVESGKLTGDKQMQSGMSCILPRRTWAALLYLLSQVFQNLTRQVSDGAGLCPSPVPLTPTSSL